jgi:hypothetical protein
VAGRVHRGRKCTRIPIERTGVLPIENEKRTQARLRSRAISRPPARQRAPPIAAVPAACLASVPERHRPARLA